MPKKQSDGIFNNISKLFPTNSSLNNSFLAFPELDFNNHYRSNISKISILVRDLLKEINPRFQYNWSTYNNYSEWLDDHSQKNKEYREELLRKVKNIIEFEEIVKDLIDPNKCMGIKELLKTIMNVIEYKRIYKKINKNK
jgi:hypothetical protein